MPLPPVLDNVTGRFWLDYTTGRLEHTMMVRFIGATPAFSGVDSEVLSLLNLLAPLLPETWRPIRARWAAEGSDISLPYPLSGGLAAFEGTNSFALGERDEPRELRWVGRSPTTGRRASLSLYGAIFDTPANYRFGPGENLASSVAVNTLLNSRSDILVTKDMSKATWYTYVNVNFNSYWESAARSS